MGEGQGRKRGVQVHRALRWAQRHHLAPRLFAPALQPAGAARQNHHRRQLQRPRDSLLGSADGEPDPAQPAERQVAHAHDDARVRRDGHLARRQLEHAPQRARPLALAGVHRHGRQLLHRQNLQLPVRARRRAVARVPRAQLVRDVRAVVQRRPVGRVVRRRRPLRLPVALDGGQQGGLLRPAPQGDAVVRRRAVSLLRARAAPAAAAPALGPARRARPHVGRRRLQPQNRQVLVRVVRAPHAPGVQSVRHGEHRLCHRARAQARPHQLRGGADQRQLRRRPHQRAAGEAHRRRRRLCQLPRRAENHARPRPQTRRRRRHRRRARRAPGEAEAHRGRLPSLHQNLDGQDRPKDCQAR
mmetsp:Transcript_4886/g.16940  ORF Transcript_4886/g.16940 Transcript_4886/m.16940 type:complete len:357 (+) Transcript_4886:1486-2556(+)